jgi:hypothetical protein
MGGSKVAKKTLVLKGELMSSQAFEKLLRAPWTWRQPLTRIPANFSSSISDLFVWRNSSDWQTSFELIDIPGLFFDRQGDQGATASLILFDSSGAQIISIEIKTISTRRQTIDLASYLNDTNEEVGTFAVFHKQVPTELSKIGSFLAERGYVSYRYQGAPLRSYVHGNLDAIAQNTNHQLQMLGCSSFFQREYRLQFVLMPGSIYHLCIVNPTSTEQRCVGRLISINNGKILSSHTFYLKTGAIHVLYFQDEVIEPARMVIESNMIMARPLVFNIKNFKMDVFHG